jgi:uncharacterized repeat protein (TIGR02543 family)
MSTVYSGYSKGWKPVGSDIYKKYRARLDYSLVSETATTITYRAVLYVNINSSVNASYSGTLNISGTTYTGSCKTVFGETNTVTCVSAKTKTFNKGATATTATIKGGVRSSNGSWTGATVTASATVTIPALAPATITFNANGGSGSVSAISTYVGVANTIPSNSLTRTGYTFNGWNTASDGSGTAYATGSTITPSGDVTLYAQWKTTFVKPEIQNLLAFRTANASGGASPTVTSTGTTGFCKFQLVGGANYTFTSATVQFGTATAKSMKKSGTTVYEYSTVGSIAQASAYTVKVTVVVKGTDGVSRTYTDSTYISKSVPVFDVASNGNCFAFFGPAIDGQTDPKLLINGELSFGTEAAVAKAIANLGLTGAETKKLLWTNASPTSTFAAQTVSLALSGYDAVEIEYYASTSKAVLDVTKKKIGASSMLTGYLNPQSTNGYINLLSRLFDVTTSGITFKGGFAKRTSDSSTTSNNNSYCVPYKIYGIKGV